jgi:cysteine-rich repeat protein
MRKLLFAVCLASAGCAVPDPGFKCSTDAQCQLAGAPGVCEPDTQMCSALDSSCSSGRRYGRYADALSNECVPRPANWSSAADWCPLPSTVKPLDSNSREHSGIVALNTMVSDVAEVPTVKGLGGPDGVFAFKVAAGERAAIKYELVTEPGTPAPEVDLAMYLMGGCDVATFIRRNDRCPAGQAEDMWWVMNDAPGTYYVGFDSKDYDPAVLDPSVKVTIGFPRYGDGKIDWGEACDDGNRVNGDGCTSDGLWELKSTGAPLQEKEPNNHAAGGNVLVMNVGETMTVIGGTGDTCDVDYFAIDVPQGAFPRVTMLNFNGGDCDASVGTIGLEFNRAEGKGNVEQVKLGDGRPVGTNACPSFTETSLGLGGLAAGRYTFELKGFAVGKPHIAYRLKIELVQL